MYFTYIIRSINTPNQTYIGFTEDIEARLKKHNEGGSTHTSKYKPWELIYYTAFSSKEKALAFEKYLKSHSGKSFASKHF